jgi:hypothetical protein
MPLDGSIHFVNTFRYGRAWQALGVATVFIFVALPILIVLDGDDLSFSLLSMSVGFVALGVWCYLHFRAYTVVLDQDGFTVHRFARAPMRVEWREIIAVASDRNELVLATNVGRKVKISVHFPGYAPIEAAAVANLPGASFGSAGKPFVEQPTDDPTILHERHEMRKRMWLRLSRRSLGISILLASAAWLSSLALRHLDFASLPELLTAIVVWILAFARGWGYGMAAWMVLMSVLLFIMYLQEVRRFTKGLPPAV